MNKYKICIYAISKNESMFVDRWYESVKDADKIYVLDTGSTDDTVDKLRVKDKVIVKEEKIFPWRFDDARNRSLEMVDYDADICICIDIDEVLISGWRKILEEIWDKDLNRLSYTYHWSLDENDNPKVTFYAEKIHDRKNYKWTHPVHEVLSFVGDGVENKKINDLLVIKHYPDDNKSRGSYLPLLELSVKEEPNDDRNMHYLGREYMYYGKWNECIDTLIKHLSLPTATWKDERAASMRFIARSYKNLKRYDEARMWLDKAINEAPYLRDAYVERAILEYVLENYKDVEKYCNDALKITCRKKTYINEVFSWDHTVYDLLSISTYYQGRKKEALYYINKALEISPKDERLLNNKEIICNNL